jgi:hydroxymethylglutaryl-CoA synthase
MSKNGIVAVGAYIPQLRLSRRTIAAANAWANPGLSARAKGHKSICSHDEDSLTMAVAASRAAIKSAPHFLPDRLMFASTTLPFVDRQNSTLLGEALALPETLQSIDLTGSLRAATSALLSALNQEGNTLLVGADNRKALPGTAQELRYGAGASAILIGQENAIAHLVDSHSLSIDLTDHYRLSSEDFDYQLEERWIREEGFLKIIPKAILAVLKKSSVNAASIKHLIIDGADARTAKSIAKQCNIAPESLVDDLSEQCGNTGTAHPLLLLNHALENALPDEHILVTSFGQGCDAILFKTTGKIATMSKQKPLRILLNSGREDSNYPRYLSFNGLLKMEWGMRAERDNRTAHSAFYRHRKTVSGFIGGRCKVCQTPQFPKKPMCVNPQCRVAGDMDDEHFKDKPAKVKSFTEDWLALSTNPPFKYGAVQFEGGGIVMMEFCDFEIGALSVGTPVSMQFRIKMEDTKRGYKSYFWKAAPVTEAL